MADNKLTESAGNGLVSAIDGGQIGELIKPLINEIHLFDTFIAGTARIYDAEALAALNIDDRLSLVREESKFDSNAIVIRNEAGKKLGYVPEKDNVIFARLMDAGKLLIAKVKKIEKKGSFLQITVGIFMVDF